MAARWKSYRWSSADEQGVWWKWLGAFLCLTAHFSHQCEAIEPKNYADGRPAATLRLNARDAGVLIRHGQGPGDCDVYGAREAIVFEHNGEYFLHYDGAGPNGWLACLAVSKNLTDWELLGPVLDFGAEGTNDAASASSPWVFREGSRWHMFYLGTPNASPPPDRCPAFPYLTLKAASTSPRGPWTKQYDVVPFSTKPNTYYAATASPGHVVKYADSYLMFFSGSTPYPNVQRTLGLARTDNLDSSWKVGPEPIVPANEQIENSSLYFEESTGVWFLFTNHIGINEQGQEYTDAIWVYWTENIEEWNPDKKAVVLDGVNCEWSSQCIGMPSVLKFGDRLAVFYDAPGGDSLHHMHRDIGLAWLELPLMRPDELHKDK